MHRFCLLGLSFAVLSFVGCGSSKPASEHENPWAPADGPGPADSKASAWYEKTWNVVSQTASDSWDGTKSYSLAAKDRVSQWSTSTCDWMADSKFTYSRLADGRYNSFSNEAAMRQRCSSVTSKAGLRASSQASDAELQKARNLLNAGKLVAAVEQYDRWQQSWVKGPEAPPLDQLKEGLLAPTVLFAANYLRALGSIRQPSEAEIQPVIDQLVAV